MVIIFLSKYFNIQGESKKKQGLSMFWTTFSILLFCSDFKHEVKCDKKKIDIFKTLKNKIRETIFFEKKFFFEKSVRKMCFLFFFQNFIKIHKKFET